MSSLTDVETGTDTLLFEAWQVKIEWRSGRWMLGMTSWLVTLCWELEVKVSSTRWWSLHQVTLGLGLPPSTWKADTFTTEALWSDWSDLTRDLESVSHFVRSQLQPDLLVVLIFDPRLLRRNNHVQQNVADSGWSGGKVHSALIKALVLRTDVVQHQPAGVTVSLEEGSTLQYLIIGPVTCAQITFPCRVRKWMTILYWL